MASQPVEVKASKATKANDHVRRRSSSTLCGTKPRKPRLGDFLRVNTKLDDQLGTELKTAIEGTRPPHSPPARARVVPSLLDILQRRVGNIDEAASRGWSVAEENDDDDESPASAVEDDSHGNSDDTSVGMPASPATATTSPFVLVVDAELPPLLTGSHADLTDPSTPQKVPNELQDIQQAPPYYTCYRRVEQRKPALSPHQERQRSHRIKLALLARAERTSSAATQLALPWDANGEYTTGGATKGPRTQGAIEPMYSVRKQVQLDIITAWLDEAICDDDVSRSRHAASNQPIHVFVDMSNIVIGFYNCLKAVRNIAPEERIMAPAFFFEGFARCLERFRPCAKRVLATSLRAGATTPAYLLQAERVGYETNILQRVRGSKKTLQRYSSYQSQQQPYQNQQGGGVAAAAAATAAANILYMSDQGGEFWAAGAGFREQGVDELLHLKMMQSLLDTAAPATMVLATGDAAEAEFSDGFHRNVVRALERGWHVEVIGWRDNMSSAWFGAGFVRRWARQFRVCCLDALVEELVAGCHVG